MCRWGPQLPCCAAQLQSLSSYQIFVWPSLLVCLPFCLLCLMKSTSGRLIKFPESCFQIFLLHNCLCYDLSRCVSVCTFQILYLYVFFNCTSVHRDLMLMCIFYPLFRFVSFLKSHSRNCCLIILKNQISNHIYLMSF